MLVDGDPGLKELEPSEEGIFFHINVFRAVIAYTKELCAKVRTGDLEAVFACDRPSTRWGGWGDGVKQRLEEWEEHEYQRKERNAKGTVVCDSIREWKAKERQSPSSKRLSGFFTGDDSRELQQEYLVAMLDAMVREWEKVMKQGLEGSLRESCRTQWMKDILDKCSHHTMSCESVLGCMKAVNKLMQTGAHARKAARTNARVSDTWGVFHRLSEAEQTAVMDAAAQLKRPERESERLQRLQREANPRPRKRIRCGYLRNYVELCRKRHDEAEVKRKFRALEEFITKAATEYADAIQLHGLEVWGEHQLANEDDHDVDKMLRDNKYKTKQLELMEEQMQIITIGWGYKVRHHCIPHPTHPHTHTTHTLLTPLLTPTTNRTLLSRRTVPAAAAILVATSGPQRAGPQLSTSTASCT
jgi:hypothetical protein